jgi:hypothetical protein
MQGRKIENAQVRAFWRDEFPNTRSGCRRTEFRRSRTSLEPRDLTSTLAGENAQSNYAAERVGALEAPFRVPCPIPLR